MDQCCVGLLEEAQRLELVLQSKRQNSRFLDNNDFTLRTLSCACIQFMLWFFSQIYNGYHRMCFPDVSFILSFR